LWDGPSVAAGDVPWGVGALLAAKLPGTEVVRLTTDDSDVSRVLADHPDRRVVMCVRDARRLPWQVRAVQAARAERPDLVVVDHGIGTPSNVLGEHYVLAYGASRVTAEAACRLMVDWLARSPARRPSVRWREVSTSIGGSLHPRAGGKSRPRSGRGSLGRPSWRRPAQAGGSIKRRCEGADPGGRTHRAPPWRGIRLR